jgi:hypothetical protein
MTRTQQIIFIVLLIALAVAQYLVSEGYFKRKRGTGAGPIADGPVTFGP